MLPDGLKSDVDSPNSVGILQQAYAEDLPLLGLESAPGASLRKCIGSQTHLDRGTMIFDRNGPESEATPRVCGNGIPRYCLGARLQTLLVRYVVRSGFVRPARYWPS